MRDITERVRQAAEPQSPYKTRRDLSKDALARAVKELESAMKEAAKQLEFEKAAMLRDEMVELRKLLVSQEALETTTTKERVRSPRQ